MSVILDDRCKKILQAIVQIYIKTAEPVGSRTIARYYNLGISPATIRNAMNDLEELGFIMQPHTSAGRVPTHKGYRYYVDTLMERSKLSKQEEKNIEVNYNDKINEFNNDIFRITSKMLALISNYAGVTLSPCISRSTIRKIEFIPLSGRKILMIAITNSNVIKNKIIELIKPISADELHIISKMFTDKFGGLSFPEISNVTMDKMELHNTNYEELLKNAINFAKNCLENEYEDEIYLEGTGNILKHPDFAQINKTKEIFKILEDKKNFMELLQNVIEVNGVNVLIGEETHISEMQDCSIVICSYKIKGYPSGIIGIIGPTRMKYGKIFSIVEFTSFQLEKALSYLIE